MSLVTPDFGLLFWMLVIFGALFFVLAKFGFPVISSMVRKRADYIEDSLVKAQQARVQLEQMAQEHERMIEETKKEQSRILKDASDARDRMILQAKSQAQAEADKIIAHAKIEIEAERESIMRDIHSEISLISMQVAEKILRENLSKTPEQLALIDRLVKEVSQSNIKN